MVAKSHLAGKVFTMSPGEENYRTKLRRIDSIDISTAVPVLVPSFSKPDPSVFTFTATKNGQSNPNPLVTGSREEISRVRCRSCNRRKVTKASSTSGELGHFSRDDSKTQVQPFSRTNVNFMQSEPSTSIQGLQPQHFPGAEGSTAKTCPNLFPTSFLPLENQNHPVKKLEDVDQIVKKASEMVKLLESHIAALQLSSQALKTPCERMKPVQTYPTISFSNFNSEEPVNHINQAIHKFMETSMPPVPTFHQSTLTANSCGQQSPSPFNFTPASTFPFQTPSPAVSLSYTPSHPPSHAITCPCQIPSPAPPLSYIPCHLQSPAPCQILKPIPMQRPSSIPSQATSHTQSPNVKNIVQRLESLRVSPSCYNKTPTPIPKKINEFTFPPLKNQSKLENGNMYRTPTEAGSVVSSSSGVVNGYSKQPNKPGQTRIPALTSKARPTTSKLIRSNRLPPRQQDSSDYDDDSGSSVSSSSWTTVQQSGSETDAYTYSYSAESSTSPQSEYSTEASSSSITSQNNQPPLSISRFSIARSIKRHRSKKKPPSSKEKPISRLRRIKNKLGLIFHHHHHHHHHHHEAEKTKPSAAVKRRDQQRGAGAGALLNGLMRHVRPNKKKSKPLKEIRRLKKKVQLGKVAKRRRGLKLPNFNNKSKFKAVKK